MINGQTPENAISCIARFMDQRFSEAIDERQQQLFGTSFNFSLNNHG